MTFHACYFAVAQVDDGSGPDALLPIVKSPEAVGFIPSQNLRRMVDGQLCMSDSFVTMQTLSQHDALV